ncbi:MAG TPA: CdaR family protein [Blastocatellia bacterium]|nr:CdaR family protein [Blastocatellia bacterium]
MNAVIARIRYWTRIGLEYGKDYVLENTGLKVLALLITGVLWLSVASRPVSEVTLHNVPIELANPPRSPNLIPSKYDTLSASVSLRGPRDTLDMLRSNQLTVIADMTGIEPGVRVIPLKLDRTHLPANVEDVEIDPQRIRVTVEREMTKDVPIKPRFDGDPKEGYEVRGWHISPSEIQIVGASSQVRGITEVSTETVGLTGRNSSFSELVAIDIGTANVNIGGAADRKALLQVDIGEVTKERVVSGIPVNLAGAPPRVYPLPGRASVKVSGPRSQIDALSAADITVAADYPLGGRASHLKLTATLSGKFSQLKVLSVDPEVVRVR